MSVRSPKVALGLICIFCVFWMWPTSSWSSFPSLQAFSSRYSDRYVESISTLKPSKLQRVFNDSLTKKIFDCDRRGSLKSVSPDNFRPREVSLTYYGVQGQIGVSWVTFDGRQRDHSLLYCISVADSSGDCLAGSSSRPLLPSQRLTSDYRVFLPYSDCRFLILHFVNLTGLEPGRRYKYRLFSESIEDDSGRGDGYEKRVASKTFEFLYPGSFASGSASSSSSASSFFSSSPPQRFLVFADIGVDDAGGIIDALVEEVERNSVDMLLSSGDYAYDLMSPARDGIQLADIFKDQMEPIASKIPFMTCPGNHERFPDPGGDFYQYLWRFRMPGTWPDEADKRLSYSINVGKAHLVFINTEAFYGKLAAISSVAGWLKIDLLRASAERHLRPWIIVLGHVPIYCPAVYPPTSRWFCRGIKSQLHNPVGIAIEHILKEHAVDLALWGDFHQYERTYPMYRDNRVPDDHAGEEELKARDSDGNEADAFVNPRAPIHVVNGVGGNNEGIDILELEGGPNTAKDFRVPPWTAFRSRDPGFGRLTLFNSTHLHYSQVSVFQCPLIDDFSESDPCGASWPQNDRNKVKNPTVIDQFWIVKK